jgi:hypothetical protein
VKGTDTSAAAAPERVLRAKYLDWCSAQVADHFLLLSPDEIFELAERAGQGAEQPLDRSLSASNPDDSLSAYRSMVERVTEVLADQLELPEYEAWLEMYRKDPAGVEAKLLGFWKDV